MYDTKQAIQHHLDAMDQDAVDRFCEAVGMDGMDVEEFRAWFSGWTDGDLAQLLIARFGSELSMEEG